MMTATFRDDLGTFVVENIANIQYSANDGIWSVMFEDYETEEYKAQLMEISVEGY